MADDELPPSLIGYPVTFTDGKPYWKPTVLRPDDILMVVTYWNTIYADETRRLVYNRDTIVGLGRSRLVVGMLCFDAIDPDMWLIAVNEFAIWFFLVATKRVSGGPHATDPRA